VITKDNRFDIPIWDEKAHVISETGGGDAAMAGFIVGMLSGYPPEKAGHISMAYAGACVSQVATQLDNPMAILKRAQDDPRVGKASGEGELLAHGIPPHSIRSK
jgi:sugar/nucleoside kinase (ribokinase family)